MQRRVAAPCLLCVVVTCAMCHSRRYALGRGTGAAFWQRSGATHITCHHNAGRHYAAHVHFAPTPEEGIVYHGQLCQSFLCLGSAAPWGCSLAERHRLIGSVCHDFTSDNDSDTHHQYEIKKFFLMDTPIPDIQFCSR